MTSYDRLRSIGVSVETADAIAPILDSLSPKKREAFLLWAMGKTGKEVADVMGVSRQYVSSIICEIRKLVDKNMKSVLYIEG